MVKRVLLICYHFPPVAGSSGVQRSLSLVKYLGRFGWEATVLTVKPEAYVARNESQISEIPEGTKVFRADAFDLKKRFSVLGYYPAFMALPDRWNSWAGSGVRVGLEIIRDERPDIILSTFPIATAHLIGLRLARKTGLPWVADFRDSMTEEAYPRERLNRAFLRGLEKRVVSKASKVVFTAPGCLEMYAGRYPKISHDKWTIVENGYDEQAFARAEKQQLQRHSARNSLPPGKHRKKLLLHSGGLYPIERDPTAFLDALMDLKTRYSDLQERLLVRFRACAHEEQIGKMVSERDLEKIVELAPGVGYDDALSEMMTADALLLFQGSDCNHQIPAKIYEYLRVGTPILALTDPEGDTAAVLVKRGFGDSVTSMTDSSAIRLRLQEFLQGEFKNERTGSVSVSDDSRFERVRSFTRLFEDLLDQSVM